MPDNGPYVDLRLTEAEARLLYDAASNMADDAEDYYGARDATILGRALVKLQKARDHRAGPSQTQTR
jgi:hypothetical protein